MTALWGVYIGLAPVISMVGFTWLGAWALHGLFRTRDGRALRFSAAAIALWGVYTCATQFMAGVGGYAWAG